MRIEKKLNEEIWPHFLKALDKTSIDKYGVINRNLSCAMAIKSENTIWKISDRSKIMDKSISKFKSKRRTARFIWRIM